VTRLLRPKIILPLLLSTSLLAALYFLLLIAAHTAVRGAQWHELLAALEIDAPLRSQMFAFLVGEVTNPAPYASS
jgi:hypothetical protein